MLTETGVGASSSTGMVLRVSLAVVLSGMLLIPEDSSTHCRLTVPDGQSSGLCRLLSFLMSAFAH
jgi:hypothetical protein